MKNVVNGRYRDWWELLGELPKGWRIDRTSGSPLAGYAFATNGSPLKKGFKRALVKCEK